MSQPTWLTTKKAAAILGYEPCTLEKWRRLGRGPRFYKPAGRVRYDEQDVLAFLASSAVAPEA
jgi:predicted site-specific integrase-resolvase